VTLKCIGYLRFSIAELLNNKIAEE